MQEIFGNDVFTIIKRFISLPDLYNLSLSCKKNNETITKNDIKCNITKEIKRRLQNIFGDNYDEFIEILKITNSTIFGSFITQCALGEIWEEKHISICVPKPIFIDHRIPSNESNPDTDTDTDTDSVTVSVSVSDLDTDTDTDTDLITNSVSVSDDRSTNFEYKKITKFMKSKKYKKLSPKTINYKIDEKYIQVQHNKFIVGKIYVDIYLFERINIYLHEFIQTFSNISRNIYTLLTDSLYINNIYEIFGKHFELKKSIDSFTFYKLYSRGFKFYKSDDPEKNIMENDHILYLFYDVIQVRNVEQSCNNKINYKNEFILENNKIYCMTRERNYMNDHVFDIIKYFPQNEKSMTYHHIRINECQGNGQCQKQGKYKNIVKLLFPLSVHYHCNYIKVLPFESEKSTKSEKEFILLLS